MSFFVCAKLKVCVRVGEGEGPRSLQPVKREGWGSDG